MEKKPTIFITLSDVHIGHQSIEQITKEFFDEESGFFAKLQEVVDYCKENDIIFGGVFITGDLFDHQLSLNSSFAKFAMDLIHALCRIVIVDHGGTIIILKGTRSHDLEQLMIFEPFETEFEDKFFIANTLCETNVLGYNILIIPEEYMKNQTEYYADAFANEYDIILGHGFFKYNCFNKNEVERPMPEMPIFNQDEILDIARVTIFGHDHRHQDYRGRIFYNGSYSRLCHGEEEDKGGIILYIDEDSFEVQQLVNELAPSYSSVALESLVKKDLNYETAVKAIKKYKESVDFLKVKVSLETVHANPTMVELIVSTFNSQYKRGIVIDAPAFNLTNGELVVLSTESSDGIDGENKDEETVKGSTKFDFLFDTTINMDEKILQYIDLKHNGTISIDIDDIRDVISE